MDASPSDSSTSTRNPCSTAGLAHQAALAWPPSVAAPTLYHHQWWRPRHRPSPQRRRGDNTNSGTLGAPAPAFDFSVPALEPSTAAGNGRPGLLPEHPLSGRRTAYGGARQRRRTLAATDPRGAGSSQGAGGSARAWRWRRPSMAAERTRRWRRQTAHRGLAAAPNRGGGGPRAKGQQRRPPAASRGGSGPQEAAVVPHQRSDGGGSRGRSESLTATPCPPFSWAKPGQF